MSALKLTNHPSTTLISSPPASAMNLFLAAISRRGIGSESSQTLKKVNRTSQVDYYFRNVGMQMACLTFFLKIKDAKWLSLLFFEKKKDAKWLALLFFHFKI